MDKALDAKTLGELDELMDDLPAIDLYRLPDASLRQIPPHSGQSLLPKDFGGAATQPNSPGAVALGPGPRATSALIAVWAVMAVIGIGTWFPWWALIAIPWIWVLIRRSQR